MGLINWMRRKMIRLLIGRVDLGTSAEEKQEALTPLERIGDLEREVLELRADVEHMRSVLIPKVKGQTLAIQREADAAEDKEGQAQLMMAVAEYQKGVPLEQLAQKYPIAVKTLMRQMGLG